MTADMEKRKRMAVFSGSSNLKLADEIAREIGISLGNVKLEKFANGEIYARYQESVRGADVFIVQSVCSSPNGFDVNDNLMELLIMIDAAKRASAHSVSAVITHYGYARQDRKAAPREQGVEKTKKRSNGGRSYRKFVKTEREFGRIDRAEKRNYPKTLPFFHTF